MIIILFNTIITNIIIFSFGSVFFSFFFREKLSKDNLSEIPLFGIIFLSFIAVTINFFFPINKIIGTIILIVGLCSLIVILKKNYFSVKKIFCWSKTIMFWSKKVYPGSFSLGFLW